MVMARRECTNSYRHTHATGTLVLEKPSMLRSRAACKSAGSLGSRESVVSSERGNTMSHNVIFRDYERESVQPRGLERSRCGLEDLGSSRPCPSWIHG
jgi:hypothetical protein